MGMRASCCPWATTAVHPSSQQKLSMRQDLVAGDMTLKNTLQQHQSRRASCSVAVASRGDRKTQRCWPNEWGTESDSQAEGAGMASSVNARKEERRNLRAQLRILQQPPCLGVLRPQQQIRKAAALRRRPLHVRQEPPDQALHTTPHSASLSMQHDSFSCPNSCPT